MGSFLLTVFSCVPWSYAGMTSHALKLSSAMTFALAIVTLAALSSDFGSQALLFTLVVATIAAGIVALMAGISVLAERLSVFWTRYTAR